MSSAVRSGFAYLAQDLDRVRHVLAETVTAGASRIRGPLLHFVTRHGRLFRPTLALTSAYALNPDTPANDAVVKSAAAVEILHLATLYHDDLCDKATIRRGLPTVNAQFGDATALVCGDYLLACCTAIAASLGRDEVALISETLKVICMGQLQETLDLNNLERTEEAYLSAAAGKTAKLMSTSAVLGAMQAGATPAQQKIFASYGHHVGMAFQIWDDILDLWQAEGNTGKASGIDIRNGIYTLPIIYGLQKHEKLLGTLLTGTEITTTVQYTITSMLEQSDALHKAVRLAKWHVAQSTAGFARLNMRTEDTIARFKEVAQLPIPEINQLLPPPRLLSATTAS